MDHSDVEFDETTIDLSKKDNITGGLSRVVIPNKSKVNVHPFLDELELIASKLKSAWIPDIEHKQGAIEEYDKLYDELLETNSQLWDLEDKIRVLKSAPAEHSVEAYKRAADIAFEIVDANDRRSSLVQKINALWNINQKEKLYA